MASSAVPATQPVPEQHRGGGLFQNLLQLQLGNVPLEKWGPRGRCVPSSSSRVLTRWVHICPGSLVFPSGTLQLDGTVWLVLVSKASKAKTFQTNVELEEKNQSHRHASQGLSTPPPNVDPLSNFLTAATAVINSKSDLPISF